MEYNYNKLWKLLIDKKLMKKDLMEKTGITSSGASLRWLICKNYDIMRYSRRAQV